tara:strand:- start:188 stop:316 length:129 start_codon:yes stop_codon:yes gene_type:complete
MKKLLLDSLALCKDLVLLRAAREVYVVLAAALAAGLVAGPLL